MIEPDSPLGSDADDSTPEYSEALIERFALNDLSQSPIPVLMKICERESAAGHAP